MYKNKIFQGHSTKTLRRTQDMHSDVIRLASASDLNTILRSNFTDGTASEKRVEGKISPH